MRRILTLAGVAAGLVVGGATAYAEYPEKNIHVMIPFSAGGGTDVPGRLFSIELEKILDTNIIVTNVTGAGGTIGATKLSKERPDGYHLGFMPVGTTTTQPHIRKTAYSDKSWEPICMVAQGPLYVTVAKDSGMNTFQDLIDRAKEGGVVTGGPPPGSLPHIAQAAVALAHDVEFTYIPHEGINEVVKSMLGGRVHMAIWFGDAAQRFDLVPLAILDSKRSEEFPDVPTAAELGKPIEHYVWFGFFAPAGTPSDIIEKLSAACEEAVQQPSFVEGMAKAKRLIRYMPTDEFREFFTDQYKNNGKLLRDAGLIK